MISFGFGSVTLMPLDSDETTIKKTLEWRNNPKVYQWCRQRTVISNQEHLRWFDSQSKDPSIQMFAIYGKQDFVGVCGLTSIDKSNQNAEFSLYINPGLHSCGFGTDALKTLLKHGFNDLNLNMIWGETFDGNPAAKVFDKIGMKLDGTRRQFYFKKGKFIDAHLYSMLRSECPF